MALILSTFLWPPEPLLQYPLCICPRNAHQQQLAQRNVADESFVEHSKNYENCSGESSCKCFGQEGSSP